MTDEGEEQEDQVERKSVVKEKVYVKMAEEVLGYKKRKNKPWFSKEAWTLVDQTEANLCKIRETKTEMAR